MKEWVRPHLEITQPVRPPGVHVCPFCLEPTARVAVVEPEKYIAMSASKWTTYRWTRWVARMLCTDCLETWSENFS